MRSPEMDSEHSETDSVGSSTDSQSSGLGAVRHQRRSAQRSDVFSLKAMAPRWVSAVTESPSRVQSSSLSVI